MSARVLRHSVFWSVVDKVTGRKIADCGTEEDALLLVSFAPEARVATRSRLLAGPVVDVAVQPLLPTGTPVPATGSHRSGSVPAGALPPVALVPGTGEPVEV